jgi:hypothetical protein
MKKIILLLFAATLMVLWGALSDSAFAYDVSAKLIEAPRTLPKGKDIVMKVELQNRASQELSSDAYGVRISTLYIGLPPRENVVPYYQTGVSLKPESSTQISLTLDSQKTLSMRSASLACIWIEFVNSSNKNISNRLFHVVYLKNIPFDDARILIGDCKESVNLGEAIVLQGNLENKGTTSWLPGVYSLCITSLSDEVQYEAYSDLDAVVTPGSSTPFHLQIESGRGTLFNKEIDLTFKLEMTKNKIPFENAERLTISITEIDTTPPFIICTYPQYDGQTFLAELITVTGRFSEEVQELRINGSSVPIQEGASGQFFEYELKLEQGLFDINFEAIDSAGNIGKLSRRVLCDSKAPQITILYPPENTVVTRLPLAVEIGSSTDDITMFLNGERVLQTELDRYMAYVNSLNEGENTLVVEAYDALGNIGRKTLTIIYAPYKADDVFSLYSINEHTSPFSRSNPPVDSLYEIAFILRKNNQAEPGEEILFEVVEGGGSLQNLSAVTDHEGIARTVLRTGPNHFTPNLVRARMKKSTDHIAEEYVYTRQDMSFNFVFLGSHDESYYPGAEISVPIRLEDAFGNPHYELSVSGEVISGFGELLEDVLTTNLNGEIYFKVKSAKNVSNPLVLKVYLSDNENEKSEITLTFSPASEVITPEDVFASLNAVSDRIYDYEADLDVTSTFEFLPDRSTMHIWQKGELQKTEEYTPEARVSVRPKPEKIDPSIQKFEPPHKEIYSYDSENDICILKTKVALGEYKTVQYDHVDMKRGVVLKTEFINEESLARTKLVIQNSDFIEINGVPLYTKTIETMYGMNNEIIGETITRYSNIRINTGMPDSFFE